MVEEYTVERILEHSAKSQVCIVKRINKENLCEESLYVYKRTMYSRNLNEVICPRIIKHESVINIIDYEITEIDENNIILHILYEYVDGVDLYYKFEHIDVSERTIQVYVREMAKCIKQCHDNNVVHLDIKPENFIVKSENPLKLVLIDFGFSEVLETSTGELFSRKTGTEHYCAPEIHRRLFSKKSDVYSLGVICYMLFTNSLLIDSDWRYGIESSIKKPTALFIDFLRDCLVVSIHDRQDIDQVLHHPWLLFTHSYPF
jgi:serine/threonine protein kinase